MTNCSVVPSATPSDSGIAGAGVLLSFIITAAVALLLSASLVLQDTFGAAARVRKANHGIDPNALDSLAASHTPSCGTILTVIARKLLSSYSDQQIVTGIGIQSLGLAQIGSLVPYHFFLIWMMGLLSTAVHNASLLALVHDFRRDWVLRWLRIGLMFVNLVLSCIYGIFQLRSLARGLPPTLPMICVWEDAATRHDPGKTGTANAFQFLATVAVVLGNVVIFALATWYLHNRLQRYYRIVQTVGLVLMAATAIGAAIRICLLSQAFGRPSVTFSDDGEKEWNFGQLLSVLMLLLPLISVVEIARGEITVAPPVQDTPDTESVPLVGNSVPMESRQRSSFQPGPYFASLRSASHRTASRETGPRSETGTSTR